MKINMLSENYRRFETQFSDLYVDIYPLYSIIDDLAKAMDGGGKGYFILPPQVSRDGKRHYFYFTKEWSNFERKDMYEFSHVDNFIK